jgi:hypothetical protein
MNSDANIQYACQIESKINLYNFCSNPAAMFYLTLEWILKASREQRDLEREWSELREWVQKYKHMIRLAGVADHVGISGEAVTTLLLRTHNNTRIGRDWDRLDALLLIFMNPPFNYMPSWYKKLYA